MIERDIPITLIDPNPFQTRKIFDDETISELAASITNVGLLNWVMVRPHPDHHGRFQLIHGERRLRACKKLGWTTIPAFVISPNDAKMAEMTLAENLQREDLNPIEEAEGYRKLIDTFGYSITYLAEMIGKSRPYISNSLRLLDMDDFLQACVLCKTITPWHARSIMGLPDMYECYLLADLVMDWGLSVSETRQIVRDVKEGTKLFSWIRDVRVSGLIEHKASVKLISKSLKEKENLLRSMREEGQLEPIDVLVTGVILDGRARTEAAKKLGWLTLKARVFFPTDILMKYISSVDLSTRERTTQLDLQGIIPDVSQEQRKNIGRLVRMLRQEKGR